MNTFYKSVEFLKNRFEQNEFVNTIAFGVPDEKDFYKKCIYPLVHINLVSANTRKGVGVFEYEIAALDQRDHSKIDNQDKFYHTNLQDNLNLTYHILSDVILNLRSQNNIDLIQIENITNYTPLYLKEVNGLDGFYVRITLVLPLNQSTC